MLAELHEINEDVWQVRLRNTDSRVLNLNGKLDVAVRRWLQIIPNLLVCQTVSVLAIIIVRLITHTVIVYVLYL